MKCITSAILAVALLITGPLVAQGAAQEAVDVVKAAPGHANTPVTSENMPAYLDEDLASKHAHFTRFARSRLKAFDRNHVMGKSRMRITQLPDGSYQGRYKAVDHTSLICKVRRSKSKISPYVAVLRFYEITFEALGTTPKDVRQAEFTPIKKKRNRHIFSFMNGKWQ